MLSAHFEIVHGEVPHEYDLRFTTPSRSNHHRSVIVYMEPPIGPGYLDPHREPGRYKAVFTFHPHLPNQYPITEDPIVFPYPPNRRLEVPRREDLQLKTRMVYYAGARTTPETKHPDADNRVNLYGWRTKLVEGLMRSGVPITAYGRGWDTNTRLTGDFQTNKHGEVAACGAEFILCLENSQLNNYISEKIHNGFQSDRLVLYIGEPTISRRIPQDAFVNLQWFWDPIVKDFDYSRIAAIIQNMDQSMYTRTIHAARKWRDEAKLEERWKVQSDLLTSRIIQILR